MNYIGNQVMMLEHGKTDNLYAADKTTNMKHEVPGKRDPLRGTESPKPINVHNKYEALIGEDSDSDEDDDDDDERRRRHTRRTKAYNPNRRQRRKARLQRECEQCGDCEDESMIDSDNETQRLTDEAVRDSAAVEDSTEADWTAERQSATCARRLNLGERCFYKSNGVDVDETNAECACGNDDDQCNGTITHNCTSHIGRWFSTYNNKHACGTCECGDDAEQSNGTIIHNYTTHVGRW